MLEIKTSNLMGKEGSFSHLAKGALLKKKKEKKSDHVSR